MYPLLDARRALQVLELVYMVALLLHFMHEALYQYAAASIVLLMGSTFTSVWFANEERPLMLTAGIWPSERRTDRHPGDYKLMDRNESPYEIAYVFDES